MQKKTQLPTTEPQKLPPNVEKNPKNEQQPRKVTTKKVIGPPKPNLGQGSSSNRVLMVKERSEIMKSNAIELSGRTRSESVSDVDVKILLSNLQQVSESESEDVITSSEAESDLLESEFEKYISSSSSIQEPVITGRPRSRSRGYWDKITSDLQKQVKEEFLLSPEMKSHNPVNTPVNTPANTTDNEKNPPSFKQINLESSTDNNSTNYNGTPIIPRKVHGGHHRNRSWAEAKEKIESMLGASSSSVDCLDNSEVNTSVERVDSVGRRKTVHEISVSSHAYPPFEEKAESSSNWWESLKSQLDRESSLDYQPSSSDNPSSTNEHRTDRTSSVSSEGGTAPGTEPNSPAPSTNSSMNWWESLKNQLEADTQSSATSTSPSKNQDSTQPSSTSSGMNLSSWWSNLKTDLDNGDKTSEESRSRADTNSSESSLPVMSPPPNRQSKKKKQPNLPKRGVLSLEDGEYNGETIVNDETYSVAHGWGTFIANNGELYVGQWVNGKRHGKGIKTWTDGKEYCGNWENNKRCGYGTMSHADGTLYVGEFRYGFYQGHGTLRYADGGKYSGEFTVGERNGHGMMYFNNGDSYCGEWKQGKMDGFGVYRKSGGDIQQGVWKDNEFLYSAKKAPKENKSGSIKPSKKKTFSLNRNRTISESVFLKKQ